MPLKDPTEWMDDLTVFLDDETLAETAAAMEPTLVYGGSKPAAGAWIALIGLVGGAFGAVTVSPEVRQSWWIFVAYLVGSMALFRVLYPMTVRVAGQAVAWQAWQAFFWGCLLASGAAIGARINSPMWGYALSAGMGAFVGLLYGSLTPGVIRREDAWLMTALPLAPLGAVLATYLLRNVLPPGSVGSTASAGAIAAGVLMLPMAVLLASLWDESHGLGQMGLLYLHNENFAPKAVAFFDRAIALAPADAGLYNLRGIAWSKMDEPAKAAADWHKVTELLPDDPEPHLNRGVDFLRQGALDQAVEALRLALSVKPDHPKAHSNLGAAYERRGDLDLAVDHYGRAIALHPDYANAYSNRGYAYWRKGEYDRALEDCDRAVEIDPKLGMAHVNRAHALAALGRTADAGASYRSAMDLDIDPVVREEALRGLEALERNTRGDTPA